MNQVALASVGLCLAATVSTARGAEHCWVERAVRDGDAVNVYLYQPKDAPPYTGVTMLLVRADGSNSTINETVVTSWHPLTMTTRNPRTRVLLYPGDKLEFAGMDYGCSVTLVDIGGEPKLKIEGGLPHPPGAPWPNSHYSDVIPVSSRS